MTATLEEKRAFREVPAGNDLKTLVPNPRIVLDVGAGNGWFAESAFKIWPGTTVHSFEPASRFNQSLQPLNERHQIHRVAVGDDDKEAQLYSTFGPESNSLLGFLQNGPLEKIHRVVGEEGVQMVRLDDVIVDGMDEVDILKMDVQGAELMVLQGGKKLLATARPVIYCEVSFQPLYQDHPLLDAVDQYLDFLGYKRLYLYASPMPDLWGDAIYVPKELEHEEPIRLNIGAGDIVIPGFTAIDRKFGTEAYPLNYADNSVEEIRCVHMLEHLTYQEADEALKEWHRVLKPGGRLRVSVPDVPKIAELSAQDGQFDRWRFVMFGGQTDANDIHKSGFDEAVLTSYLESSGFVGVRKWSSPNTDMAASPISLNLEGFKSGASVTPTGVKAKVRAILGCPRIGWNDAWQSIVDAMNSMHIPIETHQGCFWWQNMQAGLSRALNDGIDWLVTLDYDSMILPMHVQRLLQILADYPNIDAIAALQMRRGAETPLFSTGKTSAEFSNEPYQVNTAHFGLTAIRVSKLAGMPKPWLIDVPDANGEYNGDHRDADITFWDKWKAAGNTIFVAPDVRIGHLELLVSEYDENIQPKHYHIGEWWNMHTKAGHCMRTTKSA